MPLRLRDRAAHASPLPLITAAEARSLGIAVHTADYRRARAGVYVEQARWDELKPWQRYQVRVHAFLRKSPGTVLCLESAAVVLGLPLFGEPRDIHVYDPDRRSSRRFSDVCVHTSADLRAVEMLGGIALTSLHDTVVDLSRALPPAYALAVVDSSISPEQGGPADLEQMRALAASRCSTRSRTQLEWVWPRANPLAESPGESISRAVIEWTGFEEPELQRAFRYEGSVDRVDFFFPSMRGVGESDGWGKYDMSDPQAAARHLAAEKRREDRLRRNGHPFARWDYADAHRIEPLRRALAAAGVPVRFPTQSARLATLRVNPRSLPPSAAARETTSGTTNHGKRGLSR